MKTLNSVILAFGVVVLTSGTTLAQGNKPLVPSSSTQDYASVTYQTATAPVAQRIISGIVNIDYITYSRDFTQEFKGAIPEKSFQEQATNWQKVYGKLNNPEYLGFVIKNNSIINVLWKTRTEKTNTELLVTIAISMKEGGCVVKGLSFQ